MKLSSCWKGKDSNELVRVPMYECYIIGYMRALHYIKFIMILNMHQGGLQTKSYLNVSKRTRNVW